MSFPKELQEKLIKILTKNKISFSSGWSNYMQTVRNPAGMVIEIKSEKELQTVIRSIKEMNDHRKVEEKITVRATAGWTDTKGTNCCLVLWKTEQQNEYNESFSFSQVVGGRSLSDTSGTDVIIRFGKKFQSMRVIGRLDNPKVINPKNPIHKLPSSLVEVSAGVQIAKLSDFLRKNNLSLPTVSMIAWVTAVGLAGTGGHGTGRDEPAFSGLIESIKVCDMDGTIREISSDHSDFEVLRGAHSGLLGIVTSIKLRAVKAFNLVETIDLFPNTKEMKGKLGDILKDNQYISIMGMPSYECPETEKLVSKWQIRKWNYTTDKPTLIEKPTYHPDIKSFTQELEVRVGASVMEFLLDSGLKHLLPSFMLLSAAAVTESRGSEPKVGFENHMTHPQVAFPKDMRDVSYLIPVKDSEAGQTLEEILQIVEQLLNEAGARGEYPVTYAVYVRYFKGTSGGLSTSSTNSDDERILAIDVVTHPEANGITNFERDLLAYFKKVGIKPRNHLGKNFPYGVERYDQFLEAQSLSDYKKALERWHTIKDGKDGAERLAQSPFNTPYLQRMLSPSIELTDKKVDEKEEDKIPVERKRTVHNDTEIIEFLNKLYIEADQIFVQNKEGKDAKSSFLKECQIEIENRKTKNKLLV